MCALGVAWVCGGFRPLAGHISAKIAVLVTMIVLLQAVYSIYEMGQPAVEVARGIAPYYYCFFAFVAYNCLISAPRGWLRRLAGSRKLVGALTTGVLAALTVSFAMNTYMPEVLPSMPGADIAVVCYKATDALMPLAVVMVLWSVGKSGTLLGIWALSLSLIGGARSRATLLGLLILFIFAAKLRPRFLALVGVVLLIAAAMLTMDVSISLGYREVSVRQYAANVLGIVSPVDGAQIDYNAYQNREWRRKWWMSILDDSISQPYLLIGRGWGSNLALDYGVVSAYDVSTNALVLRNPHNIFFSTLGRGGWMVAGLWCCLHFSLLMALLPILRASKGRYPEFYLATKVCLTFLAVGLVQGSADVFLESPQNAIPHWIAIGVSWYVIERWNQARRVEQRLEQGLVEPAWSQEEMLGMAR